MNCDQRVKSGRFIAATRDSFITVYLNLGDFHWEVPLLNWWQRIQ